MSFKSVLFGERAAGVYLKTEIFFPEDSGQVTPEQSGKTVPAVGSLVIDNTTGLHNQVYVVTFVNQQTYEPTLIPASYVLNSEAQVDRVLSYGNDIFMLYFSTVTENVNGSNVNLTRLIVDNKLSLFGNHAATYTLTRFDDDGNESIISRKYVIGENNSLIPKGNIIPMYETGIDGVRKCDGCYTEINNIKEGESIRCDVYTAGGLLIAQINLIAKKAHLLNETIDNANPIVGMRIKGSQQDSNGDLFLTQGQNVNTLAIMVDLEYSDGSSRTIAIDNKRGFCYGLENVSSTIVGASFDILVKYYLSQSDSTNTIDVSTENSTRYITASARIKIISNSVDVTSKISVIPVWNKTLNKFDLQLLKYRDSRVESPVSSNDPTSAEYVSVSGFDGASFNTKQTLELTYRNVIDYNGTTEEKSTNVLLELKNPINTGTPFLISEPNSQIIYGDDTLPHLYPRIKFDATINNYVIPSNIFTENSSQTKEEVFLENFYFNANPPKKHNETIAPIPTHFRLKYANGNVLSRSLISVDNFTSNLNVIIPNGSQNNFLVGTTVVVEFVREIDEITCEYLYGVPVIVL